MALNLRSRANQGLNAQQNQDVQNIVAAAVAQALVNANLGAGGGAGCVTPNNAAPAYVVPNQIVGGAAGGAPDPNGRRFQTGTLVFLTQGGWLTF